MYLQSSEDLGQRKGWRPACSSLGGPSISCSKQMDVDANGAVVLKQPPLLSLRCMCRTGSGACSQTLWSHWRQVRDLGHRTHVWCCRM